MAHPIVHIELSATNPTAAAQWYAHQFGWIPGAMPGEQYATAAFSDKPGMGVGFYPISEKSPAGRIIPHIMIEDIAAQMESIRAAGGEIIGEPVHTPTVGTWCLFKDPSGNIVGILQPEQWPE